MKDKSLYIMGLKKAREENMFPKEYITAKPRTLKRFAEKNIQVKNFALAFVARHRNKKRIKNRAKRERRKKFRKVKEPDIDLILDEMKELL